MSKSTVRYFEVLAGSHIEGTEEYLPASKGGKPVASARDLVAVFGKEKFKEVFPTPAEVKKTSTPKPAVIVPAGSETEGDQKPDETDPAGVVSELGEDVTKTFPAAVEADLLVFKKGSWYHVADTDDANVALNDKALKSDQVDSFLAKYLKKYLKK